MPHKDLFIFQNVPFIEIGLVNGVNLHTVFSRTPEAAPERPPFVSLPRTETPSRMLHRKKGVCRLRLCRITQPPHLA
jgi:hypothetical protein